MSVRYENVRAEKVVLKHLFAVEVGNRLRVVGVRSKIAGMSGSACLPFQVDELS